MVLNVVLLQLQNKRVFLGVIDSPHESSSFQKGIDDFTVSTVNGNIGCHFTRQASLSYSDATFYDLSGNNTYYIIMSKSSGSLRADGECLKINV